MKITCFGSRGSIPAPGPDTLIYGGNTSCYYVEAGPFRIILDNGSGCRNLGNHLMKTLLLPQLKAEGKMGKPFINLISHYHWDHIQGLPFCVPYFLGGNTFYIHGFDPSGYEDGKQLRTAVEVMLSAQQSNPHFPVAHESLPARRLYAGHSRQFSETVQYHYMEITDMYALQASIYAPTLPENQITITTIPLNHPDGCLGYRIEYMGKVAVYCTDNEPLRHPNTLIAKHAKGADWLLLDGQYTEDQIKGSTQTFGHGTPRACVEQALACQAKSLVVHHHDPAHSDTKVADMEQDALDYAAKLGYTGSVEFAKEGMSWTL